MSSNYDRKSLLDAAPAASSRKLDNPPVDDVLAAFSALPERGSHLKVLCGVHIPGHRYTDFTIYNHFQGIQRLFGSRYFFLSGGDQGVKAGQFSAGAASHLFVITLGPPASGVGSLGKKVLTAADQIVKTIVFDNEKWHAGGISLLGQILAVPIYGLNPKTHLYDSEIVFLDVSLPEVPKLFPGRIIRPGVKAGATALARLPNGHFVCAVWSDSDTKPKRKPRLDFYISESTDFMSGFRKKVEVTWYATEVVNTVGVDPGFTQYQAINFVTQKYNDTGDFHLFLIGTERKDPGDTADLFMVEFPPETLTQNPVLQKPLITKLDTQLFICDDVHGHFDAANGVFVDLDGKLMLYSAYYWRIDNCIRLSEFAT